MILIDSTGWIDYFAEGPKAGDYSKFIEQTAPAQNITPSIVVLEVYRKIKKEKGEEKALKAHAQMETMRLVNLDSNLALAAADIGLRTKLGTVDSIIYATTVKYKAKLLTSDHHFQGLPHVTIV
jgi:predicted nucleic acid-binding protein